MKGLKDHLQILAVMTLINFIVLWNHISNHKTLHGIGYFTFFYAAILLIHFFTRKMPPRNGIEVKDPKKELWATLLFALLGMVFIAINLSLKSKGASTGFLIRLPLLLGMLIFTFPVGIAGYLAFKKYRLPDLALRFKPVAYLFLGVLVWALTGLFAYIFYPTGIIWAEGYEELGGVAGLLWNGVIMAGLAEEFSRFVLQSRLEKYISTKGIPILLATIFWAFMHFPVNYFKGGSTPEILVYCLQIIPLGFVWGYLTQRTNSIVPSTAAHGLNLWGFQNG